MQADTLHDEEENRSETDEQSVADQSEKHVAWQDDDDDIGVDDGFKHATKRPRKVAPKQKYKDYLESKFSSIHAKPQWAIDKKPKVDDSDDEDQLFQTAGDKVLKAHLLPKNKLAVKQCMHLNFDRRSPGPVNNVHLHRTSTVGLVANESGSVNLFKVDGESNDRIQSLKFDRFQLDRVRFTVDGTRIVAGSKISRGYFFCYDMMTGRQQSIDFSHGKEKYCLERFVQSDDGKFIAARGGRGVAHVLDANTFEVLFNVEASDNLIALAFSADNRKLLAHGSGGRIYIWSLGDRRCLHKFYDDGCVSGTALTASPDGRFLAAGNDVGIVNIYRTEDTVNGTVSAPKPLRTITNLTTEISGLTFNSTSEILAMHSPYKDNGIRLAHTASWTVFDNFPRAGQKFNRITDLDFSPQSGYMAFGNSKGVVNLHRICYYKDY